MNQDGEEFEQAIRERIKSHIIHWSQWNRHHPIREFPTSVVPSFFYSRGNESLLLYDPRTPFLQKDPIPPSPIHTTEKCLAPRPSVPPTKFPCQICGYVHNTTDHSFRNTQQYRTPHSALSG
eukprot:GHVP01036247.1.p3 GENE.GHVP01036247.1~~GHVP01036247.1.p3  ORF type:complete len:122 (-),score=5.05 GHVP01036247.1:92-457(-)